MGKKKERHKICAVLAFCLVSIPLGGCGACPFDEVLYVFVVVLCIASNLNGVEVLASVHAEYKILVLLGEVLIRALEGRNGLVELELEVTEAVNLFNSPRFLMVFREACCAYLS